MQSTATHLDKHLGEVHQSNQMLAICNSLIHLWPTSNGHHHSWVI